MTPPIGGARPRNNRRGGGRRRLRPSVNRLPHTEWQAAAQYKAGSRKAEGEVESIRRQASELISSLNNLMTRISRMERGESLSAMVAVVDQQQCIGCGLCLEACSYGAITLKGTSSIDPLKCKGCGDCLNFCRKGAISLSPV